MALENSRRNGFGPDRKRAEAIFTELVSAEQWVVYEPLIRAAHQSRLRFALAGGLAFSLYSGKFRNTKDMDLYIHPGDREAFLTLMARSGFEEYTEFPYDTEWSYRGRKGGYILDILWGMLNGLAPVDEGWVTRGWELRCRGTTLKLIGLEELIWSKLYILYRERCDWPDLLVLIHARGTELDWEYLLRRVGEEDAPVLGSLLALFRWMCPGRAADLPEWLWAEFGLMAPEPDPSAPGVDLLRAKLFRGEEWFCGTEGDEPC